MTQRLAKRVLLIGWDAADWQMIDPLLAAGQMPVLAQFLKHGVRAAINTLHPIISPILWNSIATGKRADKHEIYGFVEPDGRGDVRPVTSTSRKAKAVWNILSQNGLKSTVIGWFASCPAERINGVIVGDRYQHAATEDPATFVLDDRAIWPPRLIDTLDGLVIEPGDIAEQTAEFFVPRIRDIDPKLSEYPYSLAKLLAECATVHNAATHLLEHEPFDLMAVYYDAVDHFGHAFMEFHPPAMEHTLKHEAEYYAGVMNACYRYHDMMLGRLLDLAGPETTVIIMSDHGFHSGKLRPRMFIDRTNNRKGGAGMNPVAWHRPLGIFAACGPGIKKGATINGVGLLDVCPTILTLLGLPVGADMDGRPILHMFEKEHEVAVVPTHEGEHPQDGVHRGEIEDPYDAQESLNQLVALGYMPEMPADKKQLLELILVDKDSSKAQVLFSAGKIDAAQAVLEDLVKRTGQGPFKTRLALCLIERERYAEAEAILEQLSTDPTEAPVAALLMGQVRFGQARYDEAAGYLERIAQHGVRMADLHKQLGRVRLKQGKFAEAEKAWRTALDIDGDDPEAHDGLGESLRGLGSPGDAAFHHMKAISIDPNNAMWHLHLGVALIDAREPEWAIRALELASSMAPTAALPHRYLEVAYGTLLKDHAKAAEHRAKALHLRGEAARTLTQSAMDRDRWI